MAGSSDEDVTCGGGFWLEESYGRKVGGSYTHSSAFGGSTSLAGLSDEAITFDGGGWLEESFGFVGGSSLIHFLN